MTAERYKLPKGWVWTKLRTICKINPKHPKDIVSANTPVSFVPMSSMDAEKGGIIDPQTRPFGKARKGYTHFANGDVLFAKITPCMENGKAAIAKDLHNGVGCGTTELHILRPLGSILSELIFYYIRQINFRRRAEANMSGTAGHLRVPVDFIGESDFPLSPFPEQKRIVQKIEILLGHLNKTRQELTKIPPLIKKFRQSVLAKAFTGELTKEWRDQQKNLEPASALLARIREERRKKLSKKYRESEPIDTLNLPELPEGWEPSSIEELSELVTKGSTPTSYGYEYQATGIAFVKVENISDGHIADKTIKQFINRETHDFLKRSQLKENDILFSIAGTIGRACIIRSGDLPANTNQALAIIRVPSPFIDKRFLLKYLTSHSAQLVARSGVRGVGMSNIGLRNVRNLIVPIPPYVEQLEIMKGIERLSTRVDLVEKAVQIAQAHCQKLAQSILAKAFRGELVEQDSDDEPVSMLLEKIKSDKGGMSIQNRVESDA